MKIAALSLYLLFIGIFCTAQTVTPSFTIPDTVCVNTPVNITNTSTGASNYFWNFCVGGINSVPTSVNLGNFGGLLSQPVFSDIVEENGNYYVFVVDFYQGALTRLDFGTSLLNTPTAVNLPNPSGALNTTYGKEGIQIIKNEGKWYAIIVGGTPSNGSVPKIVKIEFGASITNANPTGTDWGNIGNLLEPIDLHMFQENGNWYGFTTNADNNTITRFNFTNSFNNTPTAVNIGNPGGLLHYPTGIYVINDNGNYHAFITEGQTPFAITRLDFGSSLLNAPVPTNLGNPGNVLTSPRDFTILRLCDEIAGFAVNGVSNDLVKFDFHNNLLSVPTGSSLGNTGNLNFPHSLSKFFRVGNDLYTLITNVSNNTITRLQFAGCNSSVASVLSSSLRDPLPVVYSVPGTYNINLSVDEGLPTQSSFCKQVVVVPSLTHSPLKQVAACAAGIKIGTGIKQAGYLWNTGATTDSIYVSGTGIYWVQTSRYGCSNRDSFAVAAQTISAKINNDTSVCEGSPVQLNASAANAVSFNWSPATGLNNTGIANPVASPASTTQYILTATAANGCIAKDTVLIAVSPAPSISRTKDTSICHDKTLQLNVSGGNSYAWTASPGLSNLSIANPVASPVASTTYYVVVTGSSGCTKSDSIKVSVTPLPVFSVSSAINACVGTPVQLNAAGGDIYSWGPPDGLTKTNVANPFAAPAASTIYTVNIKTAVCADSANLTVPVTVMPLPIIVATSANDIDCTKPATQLNASGASAYLWQPAVGLNDPTTASPLASPAGNTSYIVKGTDLNGCSNYDSVQVLVTHTGDLLVHMPNAFTPNGDGKNDCFGIGRYAGLLQSVQFSIYDRWGVRVFYTTDPLTCWDGWYKGRKQDAGGYVYILRASTFCGEIFKKGIVMLVH
jgi:gliding motility-associated-like protein